MRRALALALLLAACESPGPPPRADLWTLTTLAGLPPDANVLAGALPLMPGGIPASAFVDQGRLPVRLAFSGGQPAAYVSTDLWQRYPAVWAQPMYVLRQGDQRIWVLGVGPESTFWSPYWRVTFVDVPAGVAPEGLRSVRAILDARLPLSPGPLRLATVAPDGVDIDAQTAPASARLTPEQIGAPVRVQAWLDGQAVGMLSFGDDRFTVGAGDVVDEQPLFMLFARDAAGTPTFVGLPNIGGTGPPFASRPAIGPTGKPAFGALWRLYGVVLPAGALVSLPPDQRPGFPERAQLQALRLGVKESADAGEWLKATVAGTTLGSQADIEAALPDAIVRTEALVSCPFVSWRGAPAR